MKKRNIVFFVLTLVFSALAVGCFVFAMAAGVKFMRLGEGNSDLGEAVGAVVFALLSFIASIVLWIASVVGGVFAGLNLRAGKRWLRVTSICILSTDVLMSLAMATFWIVNQVAST